MTVLPAIHQAEMFPCEMFLRISDTSTPSFSERDAPRVRWTALDCDSAYMIRDRA